MNKHIIEFLDKIRKRFLNICFFVLSYRNNFEGTQKRVRSIQGKQAIGVRVLEVLL